MEWLKDLFTADTVAHAVLILSLVSALGFFIGSARCYGISLGIAGVLFSGLIFGHFGLKINSHVMEFAREFGLILFVYTIGMQVGPGFVASLRKQGLPLNLMALSIVLLGALVTLAIFYLGGIDMPIAVGLFSGATTNTPALGAAQQALKNLASFTEEMGKLPGLGYAIAYPFGILGIIITMGLIRLCFRITPAGEAVAFTQQQLAHVHKVATMNLTVTNPNLNGVEVSEVPGVAESGVVISRVFKGKEVRVAKPDTVLNTGDVVLVVGPQDKMAAVQMIIGSPATMDLKTIPSHLSTQRVIVTHKQALDKSIEELDMDGTHGVTITRINRGELELTPTPGFELKFGDAVIVVGDQEGLERAIALLGNSTKTLHHPQVVPIFVGIALGIMERRFGRRRKP